jgi:hypothetical protein
MTGWCAIHARPLVLREQEAGVCFWCEPTRAPKGHAVRTLTPAQVAALRPAQQLRPGFCWHGNHEATCRYCRVQQAAKGVTA